MRHALLTITTKADKEKSKLWLARLGNGRADKKFLLIVTDQGWISGQQYETVLLIPWLDNSLTLLKPSQTESFEISTR